MLLTKKNIDQLLLAVKDKTSQFEFFYKCDLPSVLVDRSELKDILMKSDGAYVQFLLPGDKLHSEMIMHMVELANSSTTASIFISELEYPANFDQVLIPRELDFEYEQRLLIAEINGRKKMLIPTIEAQAMIISAPSRIMCKQRVFNNSTWISQYLNLIDLDNFCVESTAMSFVENIFKRETVCRLNEKLVERGARNWTDADLQYYKSINKQILEKL